MKVNKGYTKADVKGREINLSKNAASAIGKGLTDIGTDSSFGWFIVENGLGLFDGEYHHVGAKFDKHFFASLNVSLAAAKKAFKAYMVLRSNKEVIALLKINPTAEKKEDVISKGGRVFPTANPTHTEIGYAGGVHWYVAL